MFNEAVFEGHEKCMNNHLLLTVDAIDVTVNKMEIDDITIADQIELFLKTGKIKISLQLN